MGTYNTKAWELYAEPYKSGIEPNLDIENSTVNIYFSGTSVGVSSALAPVTDMKYADSPMIASI